MTERPTGGQFTHEPGGILADEMAFLRHGQMTKLRSSIYARLGKTVVVAALLVTRPRPAEELLPDGRWPQCMMPNCVKIKILWRVRAESRRAIDAALARWRGDAFSHRSTGLIST